jgi:hypothetical protein
MAVPTWLAPTPTNSWVNYNSSTDQVAGYVKDASGRVWIRGAMSGGSSGTSAFTLPAGYRPTKKETFSIIAGTSQSSGMAEIATSGTVTLTSIFGDTNAFASLAGISFSTV